LALSKKYRGVQILTAISLSLLAFRHRIKKSSDAAWHALCCQEYAERWWATIPEAQLPSNISQFPGDRRTPFGAMKISPAQLNDASKKFQSVHIENAIISMAGAFEAYMADLIGRCLIVKPGLLADSDMTFKASELVQPEAISSPVVWLSNEYVQRAVRNKSHSKLIQRFGNMAKRDVAKANASDYEAWNKFVFLRNALVHAAGLVTEDLSKSWSGRFPSPLSPIVVKASDIIAAHRAAYGLADTIDAFALETIIQKADAELLAREIFVVKGETDAAVISRSITHILGEKFSKNQVEAALARQRRKQMDTSKEFLIREEWLCRPHEIYG
jgi:hypothetical protein